MRTWIVALSLVPSLIAMGCNANATMGPEEERRENTVKVDGSGDGDGRVVSPEPNVPIDCHVVGGHVGPDTWGCEAGFDDPGGGAQVPLVATADPGHLFGGWSGGCSGTGGCLLTFPVGAHDTMSATASFLFIPGELRVDMGTATLERDQWAAATATAIPALPDTAVYQWTSSNPSVVTVSPDSPSSTATVTAVGVGTATIMAMARTRTSSAVAVTVTEIPATYSLTRFVMVDDPVEIDVDAGGNLYVANSGLSTGGAGVPAHVRRVTPSGVIEDFGDLIPDPDALIVDRGGTISAQGAGTVLVGGALNGSNTENRITEISNDGTGTQTLVEGDETVLMNPSSFAFLSTGDLLVGNYGTNSVTVLRKGTLQFEPFHTDSTAANGLVSMVALDETVYVVTGSKKLTALRENGDVVDQDLWPSSQSAAPGRLAADHYGSFDGDLLVSRLDGRLFRMNARSGDWRPLGDFSFSKGVCSMAVSPADGTLFVAECDGQIWKVIRE